MKIENDYEWDAEQAFDVPYRPIPFHHVPFHPVRGPREYTSPSTYGGQRPDDYRGDRRAASPLSEEDQGWVAALALLGLCMLVGIAGCAAFGWPLG
jgi:hypothetical protein